MTVFVSVVSHGHNSIIKELGCLIGLKSEFTIVLKNNIESDCSLYDCLSFPYYVLNEKFALGFAENNNFVFDYCKKNLGMRGGDYFIVLNPDVVIDKKTLNLLVDTMKREEVLISSINLFKDYDENIYDNSIRKFPSLWQFISSFLIDKNSSILDKREILKPTNIDWAAGSFLAFKASHYEKLGGFDENYFMYCEDVDICYRSMQMNVPVMYYPQFKALHLAKHANRKLFSKHFYWHLSSVIRFLMTKSGLTKSKSCLF